MTRILYGVCGEGMGHASRSRILINYLKKQKHEIKIIAGGKAFNFLSKDFDDMFKCEWPGVVYKNNKVRIVHSILRLSYRTILGTLPNLFQISKIIKEFKPDLLITDAEPIGFNAAVFSDIKRISIDNPQAVVYKKYKVKFRETPAWLFLSFALKISIFGADKYIIYDFFDEQMKDEKIMFLKPLIQEGILKQKTKYGDHVFVYQTSISNDYLFEVLKKINEKFVVYGMNKDETDRNLTYKKFNEKDFYRDICSSKAIISNGGFTVISEALFLKKPILVLPIHHQFEQILNGKFVENLGAGASHLKFDEQRIKDFFKNLDTYKKNLKSYDPGKQEEILKQIEKEIVTLIK